MKSRVFAVACLLFAALIIPATQSALAQKSKSQGGKPKVIEMKATKSTTRGEGADPNIKDDKQTNDPKSEMAAPEKKGGARTRGGGYCEVRLDNRSRWFVKVYVDGTFRGTMGPFGDSVAYTLPGETRVYARSDFDDGTFIYWGPTNYSCYSGQYIYFKMNP